MTARLEKTEQKFAAVMDYLDAALSLLARPGESYANATGEQRRALDQAVFSCIYVYADEATEVELNEPFDMLMTAGELFEDPTNPPLGTWAARYRVATALAKIASGDVSITTSLVGLVRWYSNKSGGASHLRKLAAAGHGRRPDARRTMPRKARQLTDDEKMAFAEGYERGEPIADLATKLGVHRTTLDNLIKRLELSRTDPDAVPPAVTDAVVESYRAGETLAVIGSRHGFSPNKVQRLLVAVGEEPIRSRGPQGSRLTSAQVRDLVDRYERGSPMVSIAEEFGVSYACVRKQLQAADRFPRRSSRSRGSGCQSLHRPVPRSSRSLQAWAGSSASWLTLSWFCGFEGWVTGERCR
ncbi:helix-turn-helix domain-containing protein [Microbacterium sp. SORGH_AS_0888]|uniref:helix-turn-helix domain-containing protein n=1 Tax=Microbacterium sp. SORGH_AS_0888 TaxID=3041791 RepID=UPI002789184D|nr:helix-turn-helix domain-containing protein [Microbacterium sp. SORGH_AS_0888]MDQ1131039.1 transposase-like protein [Microbacterium sp. SORGH_AS_0888]